MILSPQESKFVSEALGCRYGASQMTRIFLLVAGILLASLLGISSIAHASEERPRAVSIVAEQPTASVASSDSESSRGKLLSGDQSGLAHHHGETHGDHVNVRDETIAFQVAIEQGPPVSGCSRFGVGVTTAPGLRPPNA